MVYVAWPTHSVVMMWLVRSGLAWGSLSLHSHSHHWTFKVELSTISCFFSCWFDYVHCNVGKKYGSRGVLCRIGPKVLLWNLRFQVLGKKPGDSIQASFEGCASLEWEPISHVSYIILTSYISSRAYSDTLIYSAPSPFIRFWRFVWRIIFCIPMIEPRFGNRTLVEMFIGLRLEALDHSGL
jgi:hypothetical protein